MFSWDKNDVFSWGGPAYLGGLRMSEMGNRYRAERYARVMILMDAICEKIHQLAITRGRTDDSVARRCEHIRDSVLFLCYLYPESQEGFQLLNAANKLGIPTFVVCERYEEGLLEALRGLPNICQWVPLDTDTWQEERPLVTALTGGLDETLTALKAQILAKRSLERGR